MLTPDGSDQDTWLVLAEDLLANEAGVERGRMMSSDAVTFGGKVFAFYTTRGRFAGLGIRLGRDLDVFSLKLTDWEYLAPFKSKPPMMDWIVVGKQDRDRWPEMARLALDVMRSAAEAKAAKKRLKS
ncbi:MAG: hypothetical protein GY798_24270 [Hyphomicrobiales bacterium]|nr:hypothetical protein [Hyphomicrobiales bacterium]